MTVRDIVVIGASAGGIVALLEIVKRLPADFPAPVFVVLHLRPDSPSNVTTVLRRAGVLEAVFPRKQEPIRPGYIYVAPPNFHMVFKGNTVTLSLGPRENHARPAVDPLFRSAAETFGSRVIGVVLSGTLDDGTAGLAAIKARGGVIVVQDPTEAEFSGMPQSAIEGVGADYVLPAAQIGPLLVQLTSQKELVPANLDVEPQPVELPALPVDVKPTIITCPNCGGMLSQTAEGNYIHFQCHVGHFFSPRTLLSEKNEAIENAFWIVIRTLQEKIYLVNQLADLARQRGYIRSAQQFERQAGLAQQQAESLKAMLNAVLDNNAEDD